MVESVYVYIGPSIKGVIQKGTIYPGSRQEVIATLDRAIQKYPRIRNLIVSGETLAADRISVKTPGTRLSTEYKKLVAELN
ncbi:MAG: hypothetical protein IKF99_12010 [Oscillospiraceae bacterium]|nr:hypothetical protein [Oscillospiraceae bacterium]